MFNITDFISGYVAGIFGLTVAQPLDTVKARLQAGKRRSTVHKIVVSLYYKEGTRGFYRGYYFPLVATGFNNSALFGVYGTILGWLEGNINEPEGINQDPRLSSLCIASAFGSLAQVLLNCPVELVKIRQQVGIHRKSVATVIRHVIKNDGFLGLYRGISPMLFCDLPANIIYVLLSEYISDTLDDFTDAPPHSSLVNSCLAGGIAGTCAWLPVVPFDVVQTRLMADKHRRYRGMIHCMQEAMKVGGFKGLYRGAGVIAVRSFPVYATIFVTYDQTKTLLKGGQCPPPP